MHKNYFFKAAKIAVKKISPAIMIISFVASGFVYSVPPAQAALTPGGAVGPVSPENGFPVWYMDQNGLALELCADQNGMCLTEEPNPGSPISFPDNFGPELFWWNAETSLPGGGLLVLALEAAFDPEVIADGNQVSFGRIRIRIGGLTIGEEYRVRHPFGTDTFIAEDDGTGVGKINSSSDIGIAPGGVFTGALSSGIGPFLTWPNYQTNPALLVADSNGVLSRYIGNPAQDSPVVGSPVGQNFFSVTGPDINESTNLFSVMGKVAVIDTEAPVVTSVTPAKVAQESTNVRIDAAITDNLGVKPLNGGVKIDLGALNDTVSLSANLTGAQEVPPAASTAIGSGTFTLDKIANTLSFDISFSGLVGGGVETAAHIHGPAVAGVNALPIFTLPAGAVKSGIWNYGTDPTIIDKEALEADISASRTYVNIHSTLFPNGEIRGQILSSGASVQNMILTTGTQTDGTWSIIVPGSLTRLGAFTLPVTATDGSNTTIFNYTLTVNTLASVGVAPAAASIVVGGTQQLTVSPLDNTGGAFTGATVTWASSNNGVATVDANGLVTGVAAGSATITATAVGGGVTVLDSSAITVTSAAPILTTISVAPVSGTINVGGTLQLTAQALDQFGSPMIPQPAITWSSADAATVSVSGTGLVTGVALGGPVAITASSGLISGSSDVTVSAVPVCQTGADTSGDGIIGNLEILNYVRDWKAGTVSNLLILRAINFWKAGAGC